MNIQLNRREFLALAAAIAAWPEPHTAGAKLLGTVPLEGTRAGAPLGRLLGSELDARLFTDLSGLSDASLITPTDQFYVRTAAPPDLPGRAGWRIAVDGDGPGRSELTLQGIAERASSVGAHLLECAGNSDPANFGLMSVADWTGIRLLDLLERHRMPSRGRVLVSGCDPTLSRAGTSVPGASWVFATDDLDRTGAFLAVAMNGAPLPTNHGAPIRLVVPGWYGCASIKWVNRIDIVNDEAPATSQMKEFASRTHQNGVPTLARDYEPPAIDPAAMPVRVEKWSAEQRIFYRVIGIQWGGPRPAGKLLIRFRHTEPWTPVDDCPAPASAATWTLWSHTWRPTQPGRYDIVLKAADTSIRTRRLDLYFYTRAVTIADVSG